MLHSQVAAPSLRSHLASLSDASSELLYHLSGSLLCIFYSLAHRNKARGPTL